MRSQEISFQATEYYFKRKEQVKVWITASCFLEVAKWNYLLQEMRRFAIENTGNVEFLQIQFNYDNGPNIRFLVLVKSDEFQSKFHDIRQRFTCFFESIENNPKCIPITSIFLPFPTSVIEFGLYYKGFKAEHADAYRFEEKLSCLLFDLLCEEEISDTIIITTAFYLQISLIKVCLEKARSTKHILKLLTTDKLSRRKLDSKTLASNRDLLLEITSDVLSQDKFYDSLEWVNTWMELCHGLFQLDGDATTTQHDAIDRTTKIFNNVVLRINTLFGLTSEMQDLLKCLVSSSLNDYYSEVFEGNDVEL